MITDYDIPDKKNETLSINLMYGTYSDVLFILFPFLVIALQRLWNGEGIEILKQPDLSVAAAIIAGMSVGKFVIGLISDSRIGQYRERIVFFIAVTIFFVMGPALMLITKMVGLEEEAPKFVVFIQPILLIVAITLYTIAIGVTKILNQNSETSSPGQFKNSTDEDRIDDERPKPIVIQGLGK
ncbi:hypothetical protein OLMES_0063 [Oleiphilus messinensis]|uniref:Uncharacterized protein n=1 Tax=Oleiphilus messinensis TaxID=141451 RepID=A0A1Y0I149_9GAMM|nr:hypothetical protein [Oleiphilus messinensis]ARU54172.1 hypothetical protein OLMES_0063 [Oleiphilus messinensis]